MAAYQCGCTTAAGATTSCPKIKGISGQYGGLKENALTVRIYNAGLWQVPASQDGWKSCPGPHKVPGTGFRVDGVYSAQYFAVGHFRNDGSSSGPGQASTPYIWLHITAKADTHKCSGFHISPELAADLLGEIGDLLDADANANMFVIENHESGIVCPAEYWNRDGISDVAVQLYAALVSIP